MTNNIQPGPLVQRAARFMVLLRLVLLFLLWLGRPGVYQALIVVMAIVVCLSLR